MGINYSLTGYGTKSCSGTCKYCSAARQMEYGMPVDTSKIDVAKLKDQLIKANDDIMDHEYQADWNKVEETLLKDPQFINELKLPEGKRNMHVDTWGADGLGSFDMLKDQHDFIMYIADKYKMNVTHSTSTNGLPLIIDEWADYLVQNNIHIQLSHDGLGQWIRTGAIDPVKSIPNLKKLISNGILNAINCTLNFWNNDLFANHDYWINVLKDCFPLVFNPPKREDPKEIQDEWARQFRLYNQMFIKLNHIYDGQYDIKAQNKEGLYNGRVYESLKGAPIGNLNFHNDSELAEKYGIPELAHNLENYIHQYEHIAILMLDPAIAKNREWKPFNSYFEGQINRFKWMRDHDEITGACRAYQRWKYDIGDKKGQKSTTFVIDTMGNYSECNLIDSNSKTSNPGGIQPEHCKGCRYEFQSECNPCGSENFATECHYNYAWVQMLERVVWIKQCIMSNKMQTKNSIIKMIQSAK